MTPEKQRQEYYWNFRLDLSTSCCAYEASAVYCDPVVKTKTPNVIKMNLPVFLLSILVKLPAGFLRQDLRPTTPRLTGCLCSSAPEGGASASVLSV